MHGFVKQINLSDGGLPKLPVDGAVMIDANGVAGDRQRNLKYHGGPDKAVLMLASEVVDDLAARGYPVDYGSLGENLTVSGLGHALWRSGQRYRIGNDVTIELTKLRQLCLNLDVYGPAIKKELSYGRGGFYARVISGGTAQAGARVTCVE